MEKFVEQTLLYDFYGELLTERQQQVYESVVLEDYSLSEVAEDLGIIWSRNFSVSADRFRRSRNLQ